MVLQEPRPDTFDGHAYIGLVGLTMSSTRIGGVLGIGSMDELNVRLYSVDDAGRQGVVFLSMDVSRPDVALAGKLSLGLPYLWSDVRTFRSAELGRGVRVRRRRSPRLVAQVEIEIGEILAPYPHAAAGNDVGADHAPGASPASRPTPAS
jgi:uncharacterized protein